MPLEPDHNVKLEPAKSAEPPNSSGKIAPKASIVFCEALREAMLSPFSWQACINAFAFSSKSLGKSPLITRRSYSAASSG